MADRDIAYHYGDLGKSEYRHNFGNRSTGGFGTGVYFVGTPVSSRNDMPFHKDRPEHKIDVSGYNLYKPKTNTEAHTLHNALLELNNVLAHTHTIPATQEQVQHEYDEVSRAYFAPVRRLAKDDYTTPVEVDESILRRYIHKYKKYYPYKITDKDDLFDIYTEVFECVLEESREFEHAMDNLYDALSHVCSKTKLYSLVRDIARDKSDIAPSTLLMKSLGYDGIDVRHLNKDAEGLIGLDNSTYGSVLYDINAKSIMKESTKKYNMDNIKFLGYKPEFIEISKYFPFIQDAIKNDKLYSPQEIDNLLQQATQVAAEEDIYAKFYIDVVYSVDGQQKRHHGIRAYIDGEYSKGDFMPIHDEIWSYLEDAAKKEYYKVERRSKMKESYNRYAKETDIEFLKDALAEMRRYEKMWDSMSARQKRDIAPEGGLEELQQNIEYAEQRLAELQGTQNEGKQVDEKDYKWKKLKYIKNGQVYGKVGRRIGIAAPTTLPSSEGPIPGPGAEGGGDCGGCSESKLTEATKPEFTEEELKKLEDLLTFVNNFVAEIKDKYISAKDSIGMREVCNTVYGAIDEVYQYLKKEYADLKLMQKDSLQESTEKHLKEEVEGALTLQEWLDKTGLDGADVYDSDFDIDGTYVDTIVTPADNYDKFVLYVCNNVKIVERDAENSYATVDFSGFVRNNMQALLQWLDIYEEDYEDGLEDDDLYEDLINQIIAALGGNGSESQYREFMRIIGQ